MKGRQSIFVIPDPTAFVSGGNVFNAGLVAALRARGEPVEALSLERAKATIGSRVAALYWVDTLYLEHFAALSARAGAGSLVGLLAHYLPSSVARDGRSASQSELERAVLRSAPLILVPSATFGETLRSCGALGSIVVIEPGLSPAPRSTLGANRGVRAIAVASLEHHKGVLALLEGLRHELRDGDAFALDILGPDGVDPEYGARCRELAARPELSDRVSFLGELSHSRCLERLALGNVFVSASITESYGLALAEARAAGLVIVARRGGHSAHHAGDETGGIVVDDARGAAEACVRLSRDPGELSRRLERARSEARSRSWSDAADDYLRAVHAIADAP